MNKKTTTWIFLLAILAGGYLPADDAPPNVVNYQGVLRSSTGEPLTGTHDMVFRFWNALSGGDELMIDEHTAAWGTAVTVTDGLFAVPLGGGVTMDGAGPGAYWALPLVFRDYGDVWLSIEVGGEVLAPRIQVRAVAYAHNAGSLDGRAASEFLDTGPSVQLKNGPLQLDTNLGYYTIDASGTFAGGRFRDTDDGSEVLLALQDRGVIASGATGVDASGSFKAGTFTLTDGTANADVAYLGIGVKADGNNSGGYFENKLTQNGGRIGTSQFGVEGYGTVAGAEFSCLAGSGLALLGTGDTGVEGEGSIRGGYFHNTASFSEAFLGESTIGVRGRGSAAGARFEDTNATGTADIGAGHFGVDASGVWQQFRTGGGGRFQDSTYTGVAYVGHGNEGIYAEGSFAGGEFHDSTGSGYAFLGKNDDGVQGFGDIVGGRFENTAVGASGVAQIAQYSTGVFGAGDNAGGIFDSTSSGSYAYVGRTTYKILGSGTVSFVQNHPDDPDRVVVYHAPESSEVGVYTRGSARLDDGAARIVLDETFRWVANPDLGLTAHLTPREAVGTPLVAEKLSTTELVVRGPAGSDARFDYIVYGLRIGFEELPPVQKKEREALLPAMKSHRELYAGDPSLRRFNALERFRAMSVSAGNGAPDLSRAAGLIERIGSFVPGRRADEPSGVSRPPAPEPAAEARTAGAGAEGGRPPLDAPVMRLPVSEPVEAGDVLALDLVEPPNIRRASTLPGLRVVGVATGPSIPAADGTLEAPVADGRYAWVRVDASAQPVRAGDALVPSPTAGYAMVSLEPGADAVVGVAVEDLEQGRGRIRVLLAAWAN